jgi:hypothetical protein
MIQLAERTPRAPASIRISSIKQSVMAGMTGESPRWAGTPPSTSRARASSRLAGLAARGSSSEDRRGSRLVIEIPTATSRRAASAQQVQIVEHAR